MRKYLIPLLLAILTLLWELAVQFSTIVTLIDKLRAHGAGGAFMADLLLSPVLRLALIVAFLVLLYRAYKGHGTKPTESILLSPSNTPLIEFKPHIEVNPSINQTQPQNPSHSQLSELAVPKLNFECIRAKMIEVEVDISSFEILLAPSNGRALNRCMAAIAEFRRNTDYSKIDSISIRAIAELKGQQGESLSINEVRWLEHDLKTKRSATASFKRLDTKRLAVVLGISNNRVYTYEGRYVKESGGAAVFYVFRRELQELTEAIYEVEIRLMGAQGGKVIVDNTFGFQLIRGAELKDSIFRKKNPCLIGPGLQPSKAKQIEQLSRFAEEGDRLIIEYKEKLKPDWTTAKTWGGSAHTYISEYINDESAAYFSLETREHLYPGAAIDRIFVDWVYTRIKRIAEIASEVRKQQ
jgi:hypothetical protein